MASYDIYGRATTTDPGAASAPNAAPAAGLAPAVPIIIRVPFAAGAGTTSETAIVCQQKLRLMDVFVSVVTAITSSVVQCWTATGGTGSAASSSIATSTAGTIRDNLTTAKQTFAAGASIFVRQSGGATLAGCDVFLVCLPEQ